MEPELQRLLELQQWERRRIGAELHDDPIQVLVVAVMRLEVLAERIDDDEADGMLHDARRAVRQAIEHLRAMQFELDPPALERAGLGAALAEYANRVFDDTDVVVDIDIDCEPSTTVSSMLFRVAREAISNARRHARAQHLTVHVREVDGGFDVRIVDDGDGYITTDESGTRMHGSDFASRLSRAVGGRWSVQTAPGNGTTVEIWLPGR
ncbi:MAG: hypothetical protein QOI55_352 [Actinomycetota bacterium]|jgi:signal transduction histidine kinase|nr:hypothetical protein [Actinomycetota bacterium]